MKKLFTKKKEYRTNYIVYSGVPQDNPDVYHSSVFDTAKQFDSLEAAKEFAKEYGRFNKLFITEVRPIFLYDNAVQEHSL